MTYVPAKVKWCIQTAVLLGEPKGRGSLLDKWIGWFPQEKGLASVAWHWPRRASTMGPGTLLAPGMGRCLLLYMERNQIFRKGNSPNARMHSPKHIWPFQILPTSWPRLIPFAEEWGKVPSWNWIPATSPMTSHDRTCPTHEFLVDNDNSDVLFQQRFY